MGEISRDVQEGYRCQSCARIVDGKQPGYPRECSECRDTPRLKKEKRR